MTIVKWILLALIILIPAYYSLYKYIEPTQDWFTCHQEIECTDKVLCNGQAINKKYVARVSNFTKLFDPAIKTQCWEREYSARGAICKQSVCVADEDTSFEDWIGCKQDSDCVEVLANCGHKTSVNKRFKDVARSNFRIRHNIRQECARFAGGEFHFSCVNFECTGEYR